VEQVIGDVTDIESLHKTIPDHVEAIFHTAADTSLWARNNARQNIINVHGAANIVEAARKKHAKRLIHTSSIGAYGKTGVDPITEETPSNAMTSGINYFQSKYLAEQEVKKGVSLGLD
ncbi:MAG: oxidoreductase, partial [Phototrophicales bacterium]